MDDYKKRLRNFDLDLKNKDRLSTPFVAIEGIVGGQKGHELAQWLAENFNKNFDAYDSAVDSVYNQTHIGGSAFHHLLDGQHSIWGAFKSVHDVKIDDSWASELGQATEHLIRDTASVSGINPFFTLSQIEFDKIGSLVSHIGVTKEYLADALTINGPELLGGSIALVSLIMLAKKGEFEKLSYLAGGCLSASLIYPNPMLMPIAAGSMAYAIYKGKNKKGIFIQAGKGSIVLGSAMLAGKLASLSVTSLGGPPFLVCIAGLLTAIAVKNVIEKPDKALEYTLKLIEPAKYIFKKVSYSLSV